MGSGARRYRIRFGRAIPAMSFVYFLRLAVIAYEAVRGRESFKREVAFIAREGTRDLYVSGRYAEQFAALIVEFAVRLGSCCGECEAENDTIFISIR